MHRIRPEQMAVLERLAQERFVAALCERQRERFPRDCERLGDKELRAAVEAALGHAGRFGLRAEAELVAWLDLAFTFGRRFHVKRRWAARIVGNPELDDPAMRLQFLLAEAERRQSTAEGLGPAEPESGESDG